MNLIGPCALCIVNLMQHIESWQQIDVILNGIVAMFIWGIDTIAVESRLTLEVQLDQVLLWCSFNLRLFWRLVRVSPLKFFDRADYSVESLSGVHFLT